MLTATCYAAFKLSWVKASLLNIEQHSTRLWKLWYRMVRTALIEKRALIKPATYRSTPKSDVWAPFEERPVYAGEYEYGDWRPSSTALTPARPRTGLRSAAGSGRRRGSD